MTVGFMDCRGAVEGCWAYMPLCQRGDNPIEVSPHFGRPVTDYGMHTQHDS